MTIRWPIGVLPAQNVAFDIASRSVAGPASVSGATQVVASDAGVWKATLGSVVIRDRAAVITHRAIAALLEGRLNPILVPLCRGFQPIGPEGSYDELPYDDGAYHSDGSGHVGGANLVAFASGAAARATSATVTVTYGGPILPGQHFSVGERLYRVRTFNEDTGAITFRPPLREAVSEGDFLNFDDPVCRMRLATDDAMDLELAMRRFGNPTVTFFEDV